MRARLAGTCSLLVLLTACSATATPVRSVPADRVGAGNGAAALEQRVCTHPAGIRVTHPADWSVNPGDVLPVCSWFAAEPFAVPEGSDAGAADVMLSVRPGEQVPARWPDETARTRVEVAGRTAVRTEQVTSPGLYPAGTPITTYVVDLDGDAGALVARTVGLPGRDHARNVEVLDAMMESLVLGAPSGA